MATNPKVFFDISIGGKPAGRVVMEVSVALLLVTAPCLFFS
jgi:hypothetical protein